MKAPHRNRILIATLVLLAYLLLIPVWWVIDDERVNRDASAGKPIKFNPILSITGIPAGLIVSRFRPYYEYQRFVHRKINGGELRTWAEYQQLLE